MNKRRGLGIWPLVFLILVIAVLLSDSLLLNNAGQYTYSQFTQDLEAEPLAMERIIIRPNVEVPTGSVTVQWVNGDTTRCYVTDVKEVQDLLTDHGLTNWYVTDANRPSWWAENGAALIAGESRARLLDLLHEA